MLQMKNIHKAFGQNKVLTGVDFILKEASVHALMGENGAGKSTLMKILVGIHGKDEGQIIYKDENIEYKDAQMAEEAGITFIHQELNIWSELTVLENLFIGKEIRNKFGILNERQMKKEAMKVFEKLNFKIPLKKVAGKCSIGEQQMIEIAKALMTNAKIIVMDEPTAAAVGSSITIILAFVINALAISIICCSPIEHFPATFLSGILKFNFSNTFIASFFICLSFKIPNLFLISLPINKFSNTVNSDQIFNSWCIKVMPASSAICASLYSIFSSLYII